MNRRTVLGSLLSLGVFTSAFGLENLFKKEEEIVRCRLEDFWDTVPYKEETRNGTPFKNVYRIENYPQCSIFRRIRFEDLKQEDHCIMVISKKDYESHQYGFINEITSSAKPCEGIGTGKCNFVVGVKEIRIPQCWTEEAFHRHNRARLGELA